MGNMLPQRQIATTRQVCNFVSDGGPPGSTPQARERVGPGRCLSGPSPAMRPHASQCGHAAAGGASFSGAGSKRCPGS
jgi:hypothetical protein